MVKEDNTKTLCANCGGNHSSAYARCPNYIIATDITKIKNTQQISYSQAVQRYKTVNPPQPPTPGVHPGLQPVPGNVQSQPIPPIRHGGQGDHPNPPVPVQAVPQVPQPPAGSQAPTPQGPALSKADVEAVCDRQFHLALKQSSERHEALVCGFLVAFMRLIESPGFSAGQLMHRLPDLMAQVHGHDTRAWTNDLSDIVGTIVNEAGPYFRELGVVPNARISKDIFKSGSQSSSLLQS